MEPANPVETNSPSPAHVFANPSLRCDPKFDSQCEGGAASHTPSPAPVPESRFVGSMIVLTQAFRFIVLFIHSGSLQKLHYLLRLNKLQQRLRQLFSRKRSQLLTFVAVSHYADKTVYTIFRRTNVSVLPTR